MHLTSAALRMPSIAPSAEFPTTHWSLLLSASENNESREKALVKLCTAYWFPVYSYLRRQNLSAHDAEDITQGFFLYLLESDFLTRPDPAKGRFRNYLIGALRCFQSNLHQRNRAEKRGGKAEFIDWSSLDPETQFAAIDQSTPDPAQAYEKSWAITLLARAIDRLEAEQRASGKFETYALLKPFLSAQPDPGDYERVAVALRTTRSHVAVLVHRLNQRLAELIQLEVAETVSNPADIPHELQHLLNQLRN